MVAACRLRYSSRVSRARRTRSTRDCRTCFYLVRSIPREGGGDDDDANFFSFFSSPPLDQLVVFYVQRPDGTLVVSFSATGVYRAELPALASCFRECYEVVAAIADAYAAKDVCV